MAVAVWPADLPQCVLPRSIAPVEPDGRLRSRPDTGPGKTRVGTTAAMMPVSLEFVMAPGQVARLMRFWREDLASGSRPFVIRDPWFDGRRLTTLGRLLTTETGAVLTIPAHWLALFDGPPPVPRQSRRHARVSVSLLVFPG